MSKIQSVLFNRQHNTPSMAAKWLKKEHLNPIKPFHSTDQYIRARINEPKGPMRTVTLDKRNHVKAVVIMPPRTGGRGMFGRITYRRTSRPYGGAIGSDLGVGAATVAAILAAIAGKKIYDKVKGGGVRRRRPAAKRR